MGVHDFDCHSAIKARINRLVNCRHASGIHLAQELIATINEVSSEVGHG
jgi:hypothetical protein